MSVSFVGGGLSMHGGGKGGGELGGDGGGGPLGGGEGGETERLETIAR